MPATLDTLTTHLLTRLDEVRRALGCRDEAPLDADCRFADVLDSMGLVEFIAVVAEVCGTSPEAVERITEHRFDTVSHLARALLDAGLGPSPGRRPSPASPARLSGTGFLAGVAVRLPETVQAAASIDALLNKPPGWLEQHAGITQRRVWGEQDPLATATAAGLECLEQTGLLVEDVGVLLVTSEAPPVLAGLAAGLHHRLGLRPETTALEVGGACTGFLSALWLGQRLLADAEVVLILSLEAASQCLPVRPGPEGEFAALFGDAAAAVVLCRDAPAANPIPLRDVMLGVDGSAASLLSVLPSPEGVKIHMDGPTLATAAVRTMADAVAEMTARHGLAVHDLHAIVAHGGNGRLPGLLARRLGLREERVWSETPRTGNLGSASLPVAWAVPGPVAEGPVVWVALGAGLTWGAALTGT